MTDDAARIEGLAGAVGDGRAVDWARLREGAADEAERIVLRNLEAISWIRRAFLDLASLPGDADPAARRARALDFPPAIVGGYALGDHLGDGPLAAVYAAVPAAGESGPRVALKIVGWRLEARAVLARFEDLRPALERISHPGVARTLEAGETDEGRVYFVRELVDGLPIVAHCAAHQVGLRDRLLLFAGACDAVQALHDAGLRHGSIKGNNVLVQVAGAESLARIVDVGIPAALNQRATEWALFAHTGRAVLDLCYFSPEEIAPAAEPPDARSDVYALGALLFELIAGRPPFELRTPARADVPEYRRRIREERPPPASALLRARATGERELLAVLPAGTLECLDAVVAGALEKDRSRRPTSPATLANDVRVLLS